MKPSIEVINVESQNILAGSGTLPIGTEEVDKGLAPSRDDYDFFNDDDLGWE